MSYRVVPHLKDLPLRKAVNVNPLSVMQSAIREMPGGSSIHVEAHRLIRKMRGGAQAHLIEMVDGSSYIVKFTNNSQHPRIVINEWIASTVLRHLGIVTPDMAVVNVSAAFIRNNPEAYVELASSRAPPTRGSHFGSRFDSTSDKIAVYDFLPAKLLDSVANLSDFCGVLVVDKWLGNTDGRQSIFRRVNNVNKKLSFVAQMIDNGSVFDGGNWRFGDSPLLGPYFGKVYQDVRGLDAFAPWLTTVSGFSRTVLEEAFQRMPSSWRTGSTEAAFGALLGRLMRRRERVSDLITECRDQPGKPFPNWV
jgi:hypothetical protein